MSKLSGTSWKNPSKKIKIRRSQSQSSEPEKPLKDVILYVTKKCEKSFNDIFDKVTKLGGTMRTHYNFDVTHVVFIGKHNDLTKEFRTARDDGKIIVCPEWVKMCFDENRKVEEVLFPHTYNPKMSLNMSVSAKKMSPKNTQKSVRNSGENPDHPDKTQLEKIPDEKISSEKISEQEVEKPEVPAEPGPESQDTEAFETLAKLDQIVDKMDPKNPEPVETTPVTGKAMRLSSLGNSPNLSQSDRGNEKTQVRNRSKSIKNRIF